MATLTASLALCALLAFPVLEAAVLLPVYNDPHSWRLTQVRAFSWSNCGGTFPGEIRSLTLGPDPITIPGELNVAVEAATTVPLIAPVKLAIKLQKRVLGLWVDIPCVDNIGTCTYDDVCGILDSLFPPEEPCPEPLARSGMPCHCPFQAGVYTLPQSTIQVPNVSLPSWLTNGNYRLTGTMSSEGKEVGCVNINFSLQSASGWHWLK
ncbi:ganglioside GM2 activator-like [Rhinatrema bivittatum]|uniref:ganglioside GM2 activator-like n=1 Tax=Rhinatrema bivittatum TaxID=194408 RepID=UPI00112E053D|nr:ganglioside GM2 activator-like [Rhinatrema bivittatum]